jgi:hypothetical protein
VRAGCAFLAGSAALGVTGALAIGLSPALATATQTAARISSGQAAILTIRTVPAVPDARVIVDGIAHLTNSNGVVTIGTFAGRHQLDIKPPRRQIAGTGVQFSRWLDGIALADRKVSLHQGLNREEAGFQLSHPIQVRFAAKTGRPVPISAISSITITSSLGARFTFAPSDPPSLLAANRIVRIQSGLYPQPIRYSVRAVLFGGSNVVYAGSQNFFVHPNEVWTVKVLLFPMRLEVRDALFGFGIGSAVRIRMSDGISRIVALGTGHAVTLKSMPRSTYELVAKGPGFGLSAPATLTKPLVAKLLLLSWVDLLAVLVVVVLFIVGLPLLGGRIVRRQGSRVRLPAWSPGHHRGVTAAEPVATPGEPQGGGAQKMTAHTARDVAAEAEPAAAVAHVHDGEAEQRSDAAPAEAPMVGAAEPLGAAHRADPTVAAAESPAPVPTPDPIDRAEDAVTDTIPAIVACAPAPIVGQGLDDPGRRM